MRRHRLCGVGGKVVAHQFEKGLIAHLSAQSVEEQLTFQFRHAKTLVGRITRQGEGAITNTLGIHGCLHVFCLQRLVILRRARHEPCIGLRRRQDPAFPKTYASERDALVYAAKNPVDPGHMVVVYAGNSPLETVYAAGASDEKPWFAVEDGKPLTNQGKPD